MALATSPQTRPISDFVVAGGGCFGSYHTRQLLKAIKRGRLNAERILVVDRRPDCQASHEFAGEPLVEIETGEWITYLSGYMETPRAPAAHLVPPPIGPHVALEWLRLAMAKDLSEVILEDVPVSYKVGLPYEHVDGKGNLFLSHADWLCPTNCYEPGICPAIKDTRDWSMPETVTELASESRPDLARSFVFHSRHLAFGISTIPMQELLDVSERALALASEGQASIMVATTSHCHGVMGVLRLSSMAAKIHTGQSIDQG